MSESLNFSDLINEQLKSMNLEELESMVRMDPSFHIGSIIEKTISGQPVFSFDHILAVISDYFFAQTHNNLMFLTEIVILCIISSLLKSSSSTLGGETASGIAGTVCNYAAVAICIGSFQMMYQLVSSSILEMVGFMQALLPVMVTLLIGSGCIASGAVFNPLILMAISMLATFVQTIILPMIFISCVFFLINSLTENDYIKKLAVFTRQFAIFAMGLSVTLFSGITAIQGMITSPADGVITKAARYSIGNFVPIIGGFAADSIDMIRSCTVVIKGAVGIFGLAAIAFILLVPLIKLLVNMVIYKIAAILTQTIGNKNISDCMSEMGNTMITLALVLFLVALMFFIFITILVSFGRGGI